MLDQKLERHTQQFYLEISTLPLSSIKKIFQNDFVLISRIFLTCTSEKINKMRTEALIHAYQSHYFYIYKEYGAFYNDDIPADPIIYTPFGKMLFNNDKTLTSTKRIKNFFEYIKVKGFINDVHDYNQLVIYYIGWTFRRV